MAAAPLPSTDSLATLLASLAHSARESRLFGKVALTSDRLTCPAPASPEPAEYRVDVQDGALCVSLVTADRYLSQSIEQDLVHSGDKLADLLSDELMDVDYTGPALTVDHFRSPDKLFTFRTKLAFPPPEWGLKQTAESLWKVLRAYEACFAPLGDLSSGGDS